MNDLASSVIDFFGILHRNLIRDENDKVEAGPDSRSAILSVLWRRGDCSMTDLSRMLRVSKSNITFLIDRMEEQGLLIRRPDGDDRRKILIHLSDRGRREIEQKRFQVYERVQVKLNNLDPEDRAYIDETLPRLMLILSKLYTAEVEK